MDIAKQQVGGIIFFQTTQLHVLTDFYLDKVGCTLWLEQAECRVFQYGNMLLGFCQREELDNLGMISFNVDSKETVDQYYKIFNSIALSEPKDNSTYRLYHFYAKDPDGRNIEFQYFLE
jgi:predicted lactoylglutathione lyase